MPKHIIWSIIRRRREWFELAGRRGVVYACHYFGISRKTFYKWYKRYLASGKDPKSLQDQSRRPKSNPKATPKEVVALIVKLRKRTGFGPRRLQFYLQRDYSIKISVCAVYKVLLRENMIKRYKRKKKIFQSYGQYIKYPGHLIQIDVKHLPKRPGQFDSRDYQYSAKDVFTKLRFIKIYKDLSANNSVDFLNRTVVFFPFKISRIQTDHGVEFTYDMIPHINKIHPLDKLCKKLNIKHRLSPVATPRYNGQIERSIRTDIEEFYRRLKPCSSYYQLYNKLLNYSKYYNYFRPHMSINMLSPIQKLRSIPEFQSADLNWECYL